MSSNRYLMSFTTGGLFYAESLLLLDLYSGNWDDAYDQALEQNTLQTRVVSTAKRVLREIISRLRTLTLELLEQGSATKITITDPYIRMFFQVRNIMELMETIINNKPIEDEVVVHLVTIANDRDPEQQIEYFTEIQNNVQTASISFTWEFDKYMHDT